MKTIFTILLIILGPQAWAQSVPLPSCWPAQIRGTGSDLVIRETPTLEGAGWTCGTGTTMRYVRVCRAKGGVHWTPPLNALTGIGSATAYWRANVAASCTDPLFKEVDDMVIRALRP
jgi:hypothetical protein